MEPVCSFSELGKSCCGGFCELPNKVCKLLDCKDDITGHLQACHLSRLVGKIQEYELILVRAGKFDLPHNQVETMWICPKHKHNLGRNWRPLRTCHYPLHSGARKAPKNMDVVNLHLSRLTQKIYGVTVPVGSGKPKRMSINSSVCSTLLHVCDCNIS